MAEPARLPSSSFTELKKIIQGYAHFGDKVQLDDLSRLLGIHKNTLSPNNPALTELGLIEGGNTKVTTPLGKKLGRALEHEYHEDIKRNLQEIIQNNEFLSGIISTVRIKKGMSVDDLASHILYASGQKNTKGNRTGARAYADMLLESGLLVEENGLAKVATIEINPTSRLEPDEIESQKNSLEHIKPLPIAVNPEGRGAVKPNDTVVSSSRTKIAINIQLQIPATENPQVYENLFKALRKHLLEPSDDDAE